MNGAGYVGLVSGASICEVTGFRGKIDYDSSRPDPTLTEAGHI